MAGAVFKATDSHMPPMDPSTFKWKFPNLGAEPATDASNEPRLDVRQPHVVGPAIDRKRHAMAAPVLYGRLKKALQAVGSLRTVRPLAG